MKRYILPLMLVALMACKNNGKGTATAAAAPEKTTSLVKEIVVDATRKPKKPGFQVQEMNVEGDVLTVVFRYSGGCQPHEFNAYFNGGWLKSNPPQALLDLEHLNPNNDSCRALVKDTVRFNLTPLQYTGSREVVIKWTHDPEQQVRYTYGK